MNLKRRSFKLRTKTETIQCHPTNGNVKCKFYESSFCKWGNGKPKYLIAPLSRITSYNVCYTKLLRKKYLSDSR